MTGIRSSCHDQSKLCEEQLEHIKRTVSHGRLAPPPGGAGPAATAKGAAGGSVKGPSSRPAVAGNCGIDAYAR